MVLAGLSASLPSWLRTVTLPLFACIGCSSWFSSGFSANHPPNSREAFLYER